jgi:hypothetical protein
MTLVLDVSGDRCDRHEALLLTLGIQIIHADPRDGTVRVRARLDEVEVMSRYFEETPFQGG